MNISEFFRSEPLPIQRVHQSNYSGSFNMKPSPPRTLPPDHSDSDSDTGGEIEWSDPHDFVRSDSIIQVSPHFDEQALGKGIKNIPF